MSEKKKKKPAAQQVDHVPYIRSVKALLALQHAETYLREHLMLSNRLLTPGSEYVARGLADLAVQYLDGKRDSEIRAELLAAAVPTKPKEQKPKASR